MSDYNQEDLKRAAEKLQMSSPAVPLHSDGMTWIDIGQEPIVLKVYDAIGCRWIVTDIPAVLLHKLIKGD